MKLDTTTAGKRIWFKLRVQCHNNGNAQKTTKRAYTKHQRQNLNNKAEIDSVIE